MLDLVPPPNPSRISASPVHFIIWRDLFVVIDDCTAKASVYQALRRILVRQSEHYATGLGCLMIVPAKGRLLQTRAACASIRTQRALDHLVVL
ncbi:MAG: hypothetical protein JOZ69_05285 [Myxococcales bacterium]|nr:hypothetical protein [Myxococcales bacterium]